MKSFLRTVSFSSAAGVLFGLLAGIPYVLWQLLLVLDIWYLKLFVTGVLLQILLGLSFGFLLGIFLGLFLVAIRRSDHSDSFVSTAVFSAGVFGCLLTFTFLSFLPDGMDFLSVKGLILSVVLLLAVFGTGFAAARFFNGKSGGRWSISSRHPLKLWAADLVILAAVFLAAGAVSGAGSLFDGFSSRAPIADRESRPDIFLFVLDTLRKDHLSCYGYEKNTSPFIDEFASGAALLKNAVSTSCHSPPTHATMLTGMFPVTHGVYKNNRFFAGSNPKLPEILREAGYYCTGVVANSALHGLFGFDQGFDSYDYKMVQVFAPGGYWKRTGLLGKISRAFPLGFPVIGLPVPGGSKAQNTADITTDHIITEVSQAPADIPLFLFVNYIDPHFPYDPPKEFLERFLPAEFPDSSRMTREEMRTLLFKWKTDKKSRGKVKISSDVTDFLRAAYDGEISYLDHHLERLFTFLENTGRLSNALVIITGDHGEQFGEHNLLLHSNSLYEEVVAVPLIIRWPGRIVPDVYEKRRSLVSLAPTIMEAAGVQTGDYLEGRSLLPELSAGPPEPVETIVTQWYGNHAVYNGPLKSIFYVNGNAELFNLERDPDESINLAAAYPGTLSAFRKTLEKWELSSGEAKKDVTLKMFLKEGKENPGTPGYVQ